MSIIVYGVSSLLDSWLDISKFLLEFLRVIIFYRISLEEKPQLVKVR